LEELVNRIKAIIFDLDGTLIDSTDQIYQAVSRTRKEFGYPEINLNQVQSKVGLQAKELFSNLGLRDLEEEDSVVHVFRQHLLNLNLDESHLYDGVFDLLKWAKANKFVMTVATNKPHHLAVKALGETKILDFFEYVVGSDNLPSKPDPAIIDQCLDLMKVDRDFACMIGDRVEDTLAAKAAGIKAYGVIQGPHSAERHIEAGAEKTFQSFALLTNFVKLGGLE
jgi:phosphoglycolate phosphatase